MSMWLAGGCRRSDRSRELAINGFGKGAIWRGTRGVSRGRRKPPMVSGAHHHGEIGDAAVNRLRERKTGRRGG